MIKTDALIIGAGPTGLFTAHQLKLIGLSCEVVDNLDKIGDKTLIKKNIGKIGDCCLFSSSQIFHRAGVPKNYRDNMQITLVTIPKRFSEKLCNIDDENLFEKNYEHFQKFTKPYSIIKTIKLFFTLFKYKFNG